MPDYKITAKINGKDAVIVQRNIYSPNVSNGVITIDQLGLDLAFTEKTEEGKVKLKRHDIAANGAVIELTITPEL